MIKITAKQLLDSQFAFDRLAAKEPTGNLKLAYQLSKTFKAFQSEAEAIRAQQLKLVKKFGEPQTIKLPNGGEYEQWRVVAEKLDDERRAEWEAESKAFNEIPVELWGEPYKLETLEAAKLAIPIGDLAVLDWLIVE